MKNKDLDFQKKLESNIWKSFFYILSQRRHFIPILSIYFLTLPNATANQIGLYAMAGAIVAFLFEIPSGYLGDRIGHKKTLILSKIFMIFAMISFIFGDSFWFFALGSACIALGFSFQSGTFSAFLHDTLEGLGRENEFSKIKG